MRYVAEHCRLEGAPRAILWAMSYRADRDNAECWAGQRRIAREAGVSRKSVERWLPQLVGMGLLEFIEEGRGPRPDCYRFSPEWVEGVGGVSGVVEVEAGVSTTVEGQGGIAGEVIHRPEATGDMVSPVGHEPNFLLATPQRAGGDMLSVAGELVATLGNESGDSQPPVSSENGPQGLEVQGSSTSRLVQGVGGGSTADAAAADAYEPPEVDEATRAYLRAKFGPKSKSGQEQAGRVEQ
jgi:Helix-turn-helix domain